MHEEREHPGDRGLRDVAAWLTTPAACGVYLSAFDLKRVALTLGIGVTPLNRRFAVEQLFRSAAIDESAELLFQALISEIQSHVAAYETGDSTCLQLWIDTAEETIADLSEMREAWRLHA